MKGSRRARPEKNILTLKDLAGQMPSVAMMFKRGDHNGRNERWAQLLECSQRGDREAFRSLVNEIGPVIANLLRRKIADWSEIEDVCQDTLVAIYESLHTYDPSRPPEPWLFAIARYVAAKHFQGYKSRMCWQQLSDEIPDSSDGDMGSLMFDMHQALSSLPQLQREAVWMTKIEGLSLIEASARSGATVGSLKVRVHRAYEYLRKAMLT
jgi:RNA polymerase sigma-70 factor, ECF subfamily